MLRESDCTYARLRNYAVDTDVDHTKCYATRNCGTLSALNS